MKFLVIGDVCKDIHNYGISYRKNPESSAPLLSSQGVRESLGMAANVVRNLEALGAEVDSIFPSKPWSEKHRFIDAKLHQQLLRVDYEKIADPLTSFPDVSKYDAVVVSDYNKGFISYDLLDYLDGKVPVFLDTKKVDLEDLKETWVKINEDEYHKLSSKPDRLVVTLSERGSRYKNTLVGALTIDVVDPCGAGDTYLAAFAWKMIQTSGDVLEAMAFANGAAAVTCLYRGTYAPSPEQIYY